MKAIFIGILTILTAGIVSASGTTTRSAPSAPAIPSGGASGSFSTGTTPRRKPARKATAPRKAKPRPVYKPTYTADQRAINDAINFYMRAKSSGSEFPLSDPLADGQDWGLSQVQSLNTYESVGNGRQKVTKNFSGHLGSDENLHKVAVDFFVAKVGSRWRVRQVGIKSVNGNLRQ